MLLGIRLTSQMIIAGGVTLLALLVFQILVGRRTIKFKAPLHMKVHRRTAYAMLAVALLHATSALAFFGII